MADTNTQTMTAGAGEAPSTTTDYAGKIDFTDGVVLFPAAALVDLLLSWFPGAVTFYNGLVLILLDFKGVKGLKGPAMVFMGGGLVPLFPGATGFILTIVLKQTFAKQIGETARTVAKVAPAPQVKAVAAGVAVAADVAEGQDIKSAATKEAAGALSGGAGGAAGAAAGGATASGASSAAGATGASGTATAGGGAGNDFRGNFDFGSVGADSASAAQPGDKKDQERPGDPAQSGKTPYAQGSPLTEGSPYASTNAVKENGIRSRESTEGDGRPTQKKPKE